MARIIQEENDKIAGDKTLEELNSRRDLVKKKQVIKLFLSIPRYSKKNNQFAEVVYRSAIEHVYITNWGGFEDQLEVQPSEGIRLITRIGMFPIGMVNEVLRGYGSLLSAFLGAVAVIVVSALSGFIAYIVKWLASLF
jgi:hypothetical protein